MKIEVTSVHYTVEPSIKRRLDISTVLKIIEEYQIKYKCGGEDPLVSIQLSPQFGVEDDVAWIVGYSYILFGEERETFYVVCDKTGTVEFILTEHGQYYPHLKVKKKKKRRRNNDNL